jgi:hypothetical protein
MAARSKAWTVFARSKTETVGSNPAQGMDVFFVCGPHEDRDVNREKPSYCHV